MGEDKMTRLLKSPLEEGRKVRIGVKIKTSYGTGVVTKIMACGSQSGNGWIGCKQCPGYLTIKYNNGSIDNNECFGFAGGFRETNGFKFKVLKVKDYIDKWVDVK